jgi:hypothetical protein
MKTYETKKVVHEERVVVNTKCDICKKDIPGTALYAVLTGHNDWGNDSVDSIRNDDVCSDECLRVAFQAYLDEEHHSSKYINIEKCG